MLGSPLWQPFFNNETKICVHKFACTNVTPKIKKRKKKTELKTILMRALRFATELGSIRLLS